MAVRRERVILELEDRFSGPLGRPIMATQALDKSLNNLDKSSVRAERSQTKVAASVDKTGRSSSVAGREMDRMSGRMRLLADAALLLGPALVPIGAIAVPAIAGLAAQMGAAALGAGTMVLAFQGVGDALTAVNDAALDPTSENLAKARLAMEQLSPAARDLVSQIQEMRPAFTALRDAAATGLFPGLSEALGDLETVLPNVERVLFRIGEAAGDLGADLGEALSSERGRDFLAFIGGEVPSALTELGHTVGNFAAGLGEMWMAFTPLNRDFSSWMLDASRSFDGWATGLSETQGFQDFVAYLRKSGPQVADAMGAIGNALLQVVEAAAPLGGPTLAALEAVADVIGAVADSSYGPTLVALATGLTLVSRAMKTMQALKATSLFTGLSSVAGGTATSLTRMQGAGIAAAAGLTAAAIAAEGLHKIFAEDLPTMNELTGQLLDLSNGDISGLPSEFDSLADSIERVTNPSFLKGQMTADTVLGAIGLESRTLKNATDEITVIDEALTNMVTTFGADVGRSGFAAAAADAKLTAEQQRKLLEELPGYTDALAAAENQAKMTGEAGARGAGEAAAGFNDARFAAQRFRDAIAAVNRLLEGRASMRDYEQAIDDLTASVRQNGRTLDVNTQKGRDNQAALDAIAAAAVGMTKDMNRTNAIKVLTAARKDMIDAAMKLGKTRAEAAALADRLLGLDKMNVAPKINADVSAAMREIGRVRFEMQQLDGTTATTRVNTVYTSSGRRFKDVPAGADGMTVPGQRYPYGDKTLILAAPGEEVITNRHGEADRFRADRAAGRIPAYADGGTVAAAMNSAVSAASRGGGGRTTIDLGDIRIKGTLQTPWGPAQVEGIAERAANRVVNAQLEHDRVREGR